MTKVYASELQDLFFRFNPDANKVADSPTTLINEITPTFITIAGILVVIYTAVAGLKIIMSGSSDKIGESFEVIRNAIIGLLVIAFSYWIIQIMQVMTGITIV